jgi:uncharacterized membrane protein HdeD (DUF308 family)
MPTVQRWDPTRPDGIGSSWWLPIVLGLVLIGLGVWMLANLTKSVFVLALLIAGSLFVAGVIEALGLRGRQEPRWAGWLGGLLLVAGALVVLAWPDITLWALAVAGGLTLMLAGLVQIGVGLAHRHRPGRAGEVALGVLGLVAGVVVVAWPDATLVVLAVVYGIRAIAAGLVAIATGFQMRREPAPAPAG